MILLAGYGGLRWGELVGPRRRHIDFKGARGHVVEQAAEVGGGFVASPPSSNGTFLRRSNFTAVHGDPRSPRRD
jgi:hypothetical protein